jgi:hypothetical protein
MRLLFSMLMSIYLNLNSCLQAYVQVRALPVPTANTFASGWGFGGTTRLRRESLTKHAASELHHDAVEYSVRRASEQPPPLTKMLEKQRVTNLLGFSLKFRQIYFIVRHQVLIFYNFHR